MAMKWYCTDLAADGSFKLHLDTGNSTMWKRMKMTKQFWLHVAGMKADIRKPIYPGFHLVLISRV